MVSTTARIHTGAVVQRTAVWDDVIVGAGAQLRDCIVGDRVTIPAGADFERCAIVPAGSLVPGRDERIEGGLLIRAI